MDNSTPNKEPLQSYHVWGKRIRIFHWVNVISIIGLIFVGLAIFYNKDLGVSPEGKILLKTIHVPNYPQLSAKLSNLFGIGGVLAAI